jgi:hypothetical protein
MSKVCVITRQFPGARPVPFIVITEPLHSVDDLENYYQEAAKLHINDFKKEFVEFNEAAFFVDILDLRSY